MSKPTGKRPVPKVARTINRLGSRWNMNTGRNYGSKSNTMSPTGKRPTPRVAKDRPKTG